jgi:hypothetical protein
MTSPLGDVPPEVAVTDAPSLASPRTDMSSPAGERDATPSVAGSVLSPVSTARGDADARTSATPSVPLGDAPPEVALTDAPSLASPRTDQPSPAGERDATPSVAGSGDASATPAVQRTESLLSTGTPSPGASPRKPPSGLSKQGSMSKQSSLSKQGSGRSLTKQGSGRSLSDKKSSTLSGKKSSDASLKHKRSASTVSGADAPEPSAHDAGLPDWMQMMTFPTDEQVGDFVADMRTIASVGKTTNVQSRRVRANTHECLERAGEYHERVQHRMHARKKKLAEKERKAEQLTLK